MSIFARSSDFSSSRMRASAGQDTKLSQLRICTWVFRLFENVDNVLEKHIRKVSRNMYFLRVVVFLLLLMIILCFVVAYKKVFVEAAEKEFKIERSAMLFVFSKRCRMIPPQATRSHTSPCG